jgi:1,2-diacylglycerol 3-alpha-glucosyltransferase
MNSHTDGSAKSACGHYAAVVVSPHLDDAVFSCGGKMASLLQTGRVLVINVFSGFPKETMSGPVVLSARRVQEEFSASQVLGFSSRFLDETDAFLRQPAYRSLRKLFGKPTKEDVDYLPALTQRISDALRTITYDMLYAPLGVGWHVDHILCHQAVRALNLKHQVIFYEEAPYCYIPHAVEYRLAELGRWRSEQEYRSLLSDWKQTCEHYLRSPVLRRFRYQPARWIAQGATALHLLQRMNRLRRESEQTLRHCRWESQVFPIAEYAQSKFDAIMRYETQVRVLVGDRQQCEQLHRDYARETTGQEIPIERYWRLPESDVIQPRSGFNSRRTLVQASEAATILDGPLRICIVSDDFQPAMTGAGVVAQHTALELMKRGHSVSVITTRRKHLPRRELWRGVHIYRMFTVKLFGYYLAAPGKDLLKRILQENDFDVIHCHYLGYLLKRVLDAAGENRARQVYTYHMPVDLLTQPLVMKPFRPIVERLHVEYCNRFDLILAPSSEMLKRIRRHGIIAKAEYLSNPIKFDKVDETRMTPKGNAPFTVLFVGRLSPEKNIEYLLRGFSGVVKSGGNSELRIIGDGPERKKLEGLTRALGLENSVKFLGHIPNSDLPEHYCACHVFVLPSLMEVQPLVVLEAMRFSRPVIMTNRVDVAKELVDEGKNGFVVDADSPEDLTSKLLLLKHSPQVGRAMGRQSFSRSAQYTPTSIIDHLEQHYRTCLALTTEGGVQ